MARGILALGILLASACGGSDGSGTGPGGGDDATIVSVAVQPPTPTITAGETVQLTARAFDRNGGEVSATFEWRSQDAGVATVSGSGLVTGVEGGATMVFARASGVDGAASVTVAADVAAAPTNPRAQPVSESRALLLWDDESVGETGFEIQRTEVGQESWVAAGSVGPDETAFEDAGLEAVTAYAYRVRAVSEGAASPYSDPVTVTTFQALTGTLSAVEAITDAYLPPSGTPAAGRDFVAELEAMAPALLTLPEVVTVLVDPGSASLQAVLRDRTAILIPNNRPGESAGAVSGSADWTLTSSAPRPVAEAKKAVVVSIGGSGGVDAEVMELFSAGGLDPVQYTGTVEEMKQFKNLGALYLDTHGNAFWRITALSVNEDGEVTNYSTQPRVYALETATVADASELAIYEQELLDGELVLAVTSSVAGGSKAKLAITENFISKYWSFDAGVAMLHACFSGAPEINGAARCFGACATADGGEFWDPRPLREAVLDAGAEAVVAFDSYVWPTSSAPSINYLFDRLLGANLRTPSVDPPRRPFDLGATADELPAQGLVPFQGPQGQVEVTFDARESLDRIALKPTIESIDVIDDAAKPIGEMTLYGVFGVDAGTVEVDGQSLAIASWDAGVIEAQLPFTGAGHVGDVVVKGAGAQLESNEVPLTEWTGGLTVTYTPGQGDLEARAEVELRFRADLHASRDRPEAEPQEPIQAPYLSPASQGRVSGSGSYADANGSTTFSGLEQVEILSKEQVDLGGAPPVTGPSVIGGTVTLDPAAGKAELCFSLVGNVTVTTVSNGQEVSQRVPYVFLPPDAFDSFDQFTGCFNLTLDDVYTIPSGTREHTVGPATYTIEWTPFTPVSPPTDTTKGE